MSRAHVDVLIVTALKDELDAVLELEISGKGREAWRDARDASGFPYHLREISNEQGETLRVAAAWSGEMGEAAAAVRAAALIQELDPECLAMCGICAGWRGKVFLGDVIVADRVFSYDSGKQISGGDEHGGGFFHDITTYNLEATWRMDAAYFAQEFEKTHRLRWQRPLSKEAQARWLLYTLEAYERQAGPSPIAHPERRARCPDWRECIQKLRKRGVIVGTQGEFKLTEAGRIAVAEERLQDPDENELDPAFRVLVAPIATGNAVREDAGLFDRLSRHVRKVRGAEMEARAIGFVAEQLGRRRSIIVKAVSDYADENKDDAFRPFACHASAAFLVAFLQKHLRLERPALVSTASDDEGFPLEPKEMGEEEKQHEEFLSHVERACVLRHHQGTKITRRQAPPPFRTFLEVAEPEGRFVRVFPVAAVDRPMTEEVLQSFLDGIHADYQRRNPLVHSTVVHAGMSASEELEGKAHARHVRLTSFGEYQGLFNFSPYLQRQTERLKGDLIYPPELYVEQRARVSIGGQEATSTSDVLATLREMLDSPHPRFALVLGDFGTGKTFLLHELARRMATEQAALVPVLIEMRSLQKHRSLKALIAQHFAAADVGRLEPDQFLYMLQEGRIALLFDGFDELALRVTYDQVMEHFSTLVEAVQGQAKVIVTSRTQHFLNDHDVRRELGEQAARLPGYRLIKLERFNKEQVRSFLAKRLKSEAAADERVALLRDVRDLLGLAENPRLLSFIAELDAETLQTARAGTGEITSAKLYELLISRWLDGEHQRVNPSGAPRGLSVQQLRSGATALAMLLWERTEQLVDIKGLPVEVIAAVNALGEYALGEGVIYHQLGSGTLLVRDDEGRFSFIHQSVLEWLVADAAARAIREGGDASVLGRREMSDLMADFFIGLSGAEAAETWAEAMLNSREGDTAQKNALRVQRRILEMSAAQGAGAGAHPVTRTPAYKVYKVRRNLEGRDLRGEDLSAAALRGANLKAANLAGVTLVGADLTGALLSRANLARANLARAVLRDADLTDADLSGASLLGADLRGARLQGVHLRAAKLVGAQVDLLAETDVYGAALPVPGDITPSLGLASSVNSLAFNPAGDLLATAHADGTIAVWDVEAGQVLRIFEGFTEAVRSVAFSPDGRMLASGSMDGLVRLWKVEQGLLLHTLQGHSRQVRSVAFSPDGKVLATGSEDKTIRLWSVEQGAPLHTLQGHTKSVLSVAFSRDGRMLATGSADATVQLWSVEQGEILRTLQGHTDYARSVAFSPDGQMLASGSTGGTVRLWSVERGELLRALEGHKQLVLNVEFSLDGGTLISCSADGVVRLWGVEQGVAVRTLEGHMSYVRSVAFSPDGRMLASGLTGGAIRLWSMEQGGLPRTLQGRMSDGVRGVAFSPDGKTLASGSTDTNVRLWSVERGASLRILQGHADYVRSVAFSPDGKLLASGSTDGTVRLWSAERGELLRILEGHMGLVRSVAFSPEGKLLASGCDDGNVRLWGVEHGVLVRVLVGQGKAVLSVALSRDGRTLASGFADGYLQLWRVKDGASSRIRTGHQHEVLSVAFSPDGTMVATCSDDRTVRLWDVEQGTHLRTLSGHLGVVRTVAFSLDGRTVVSGSTDGNIRLWGVDDGVLIRSVSGHTAEVLNVAFSADGSLLVSAAGDGTTRFWDPSTGVPLATCLGHADGWVAFRPDGRFKRGGNIEGAFWHSIGLCHFEPGELDPYLPTPLRLPDDEPLLPDV